MREREFFSSLDEVVRPLGGLSLPLKKGFRMYCALRFERRVGAFGYSLKNLDAS